MDEINCYHCKGLGHIDFDLKKYFHISSILRFWELKKTDQIKVVRMDALETTSDGIMQPRTGAAVTIVMATPCLDFIGWWASGKGFTATTAGGADTDQWILVDDLLKFDWSKVAAEDMRL